MNKRKVLFVIHQLNHGGVQKSLVSALNAIDYSENEVTLYIRKNRIDLINCINKNVKRIIVNNDNTHYYRNPYIICLLIKKKLCEILSLKTCVEATNKKIAVCLNKLQMNYEKSNYFDSGETYYAAVSYIQGYTAQFVEKHINAKNKYIFFHTSTDDLHELHAEILPGFTKAVALHKDQENKIIEWHPSLKGRTVIIENYTDKETIVSQSKEFDIEKPNGKTVLCSCGRFTPVKGFDLAIKAAKKLKDKGVSFVWYLVGDGPERERLEKLIAEYSLQNEIILTGMQSNPYPYMAACDIYIQPSYEEAQPMTILEILRLNKPTVTTATVGGKMLVENCKTGLICDISSSDLADKIFSLINDKKLYSDIYGNLESIDYSHEFEKYKQQWKNLLEE